MNISQVAALNAALNVLDLVSVRFIGTDGEEHVAYPLSGGWCVDPVNECQVLGHQQVGPFCVECGIAL